MNKTEKQKEEMITEAEAEKTMRFVDDIGAPDGYRNFVDFCVREIRRVGTGMPAATTLDSDTTRFDLTVSNSPTTTETQGITEGISAELDRLTFLAFKPKKTKTRSQKEWGLRIKKEKWRHE